MKKRADNAASDPAIHIYKLNHYQNVTKVHFSSDKFCPGYHREGTSDQILYHNGWVSDENVHYSVIFAAYYDQSQLETPMFAKQPPINEEELNADAQCELIGATLETCNSCKSDSLRTMHP